MLSHAAIVNVDACCCCHKYWSLLLLLLICCYYPAASTDDDDDGDDGSLACCCAVPLLFSTVLGLRCSSCAACFCCCCALLYVSLLYSTSYADCSFVFSPGCLCCSFFLAVAFVLFLRSLAQRRLLCVFCWLCFFKVKSCSVFGAPVPSGWR